VRTETVNKEISFMVIDKTNKFWYYKKKLVAYEDLSSNTVVLDSVRANNPNVKDLFPWKNKKYVNGNTIEDIFEKKYKFEVKS
jgi:hypothetical protein